MMSGRLKRLLWGPAPVSDPAPPPPPPSGEQLLRDKQATCQAIFVHVHKCAGTSLIKVLEAHPKIVCMAPRPGNFPGRTGRERIPPELWERALKFTFVRNPYDRVYSAYQMFARRAKWADLFPSLGAFIDFLDTADVDSHLVTEEVATEDFIGTLENVRHHISSFRNPKYHLDEMGFIGKLEEFQRDYRELGRLLDTSLPEVPHLNAHQGGGYLQHYTAQERDRVYDLYREDFERFAYPR